MTSKRKKQNAKCDEKLCKKDARDMASKRKSKEDQLYPTCKLNYMNYVAISTHKALVETVRSNENKFKRAPSSNFSLVEHLNIQNAVVEKY